MARKNSKSAAVDNSKPKEKKPRGSKKTEVEPQTEAEPSRVLFRKKASTAKTAAIPAEPESPVTEKVAAPKTHSARPVRGRAPRKSADTPLEVSEPVAARTVDDLPVPTWRTVTKQSGSEDGRGRRSRRRRKEPGEVEVTAADALEPTFRERRGTRSKEEKPRGRSREPEAAPLPEAPKAPAGPPPKPIIAIPPDAPQVVMRNGVPMIV